jgi:predicted extracellular nuclease
MPVARHPCLPALLLAASLAAGCELPTGTAAPQPSPRADGVVAIGAVQGRGDASPLLGQEVTVEGVVTGNFARHLGGWFVQDDGDGDPATSDGLFVVSDLDEPGLRAGDRVRLQGRVVEHGDRARGTLTTLQAGRIEVTGRGEVAPLLLHAPPVDWEPYEGMRVRIAAPLTVSGQHQLSRRGVLHASFGGRLAVPTEVVPPGEQAARVAADNARRLLLLDDARADENPGRTWYLDDRPPPRLGSVARDVEGIVDQRWGEVRLQLIAPLRLEPADRPPPPTVPGNLRLAVLNLHNLFNGDGRGGGFPTARGARTPAQLRAQLDALVATLHALDPHAAALMELENDGYGPDSSLAQLVAALNAGGGDWAFVDAGHGPGGDVIRVAIVYRRSRLRPLGAPATLEGGPFGTRSRVPLAQAFVPRNDGRDSGPAFVLVANHFKSKGCGEASGADADQGDGQACWNATRVESARRLAAWMARDPTGTGSDLAVIAGDFNSYSQEDPLRLLRAEGWVDALAPSGRRGPHSFVVDGLAGRLDHALLSPALARRLAGAAVWHSNADEPANASDRDGNGGDRPPRPWRSSDHDPLLVGLDL